MVNGKKFRGRKSGGSAVPVTPRPPAPKTIQSHNATKSTDELLAMTKEQLKTECRKRGQKSTGTKNELSAPHGTILGPMDVTLIKRVTRSFLQRLGHKMTSRTGRRKDASTLTNGGTDIKNDVKAPGNKERDLKKKDREERESLVLWKKPLITGDYAARELVILLKTYGKKLIDNKLIVGVTLISVLFSYILVNTKGPHHNLVQGVYKQLLWCSYWIGLGILSSVGLGTGLHTFLLYLGPHIARVTLAAYECGSLNFPAPPYPDDIVCPSTSDGIVVTIFSIMSKVRVEAMCWGAGTALGELPPYFMARAARLSGIDPDDEDDELAEFEELQKKQENRDELTFIEKGKLFVEDLVQKVGFFGILACASIPNPLFDLAGITCGHFLVPFWTFFGATLIGKAIIKMHIQKLFVIIAFNETLIVKALSLLEYIPVLGDKLQVPFKSFLDSQKHRLHKDSNAKDEGANLLGKVFELFVFAMIMYFVLSIVNSLAQNYYKRIHKKRTSNARKD